MVLVGVGNYRRRWNPEVAVLKLMEREERKKKETRRRTLEEAIEMLVKEMGRKGIPVRRGQR